uniref:Uncharacterized protein n=1 Tax=Magnetospirillum gryphiswaldense TaxID=55518 RepID=A4TTQ4_9PROT|nr:hypothetical protein MGR_3006 [Magnetospirillum gryphiswaldense MSR-1]
MPPCLAGGGGAERLGQQGKNGGGRVGLGRLRLRPGRRAAPGGSTSACGAICGGLSSKASQDCDFMCKSRAGRPP